MATVIVTCLDSLIVSSENFLEIKSRWTRVFGSQETIGLNQQVATKKLSVAVHRTRSGYLPRIVISNDDDNAANNAALTYTSMHTQTTPDTTPNRSAETDPQRAIDANNKANVAPDFC